MSDEPRTTEWIKASASGGQGGQCVQMRPHEGAVEVRDSKHGNAGPVLGFTKGEFAAWLDGAKRGEFDHLVG
jgi:hypothetical protein